MFRRPTIHRRRNNLFVYDNSFRANESRAVRKETRRFGVSQFHWPKLLLKRTIITTLTIQFPHFTNKVLGVLSDFFGKTGIHGLAYLGDSKRSFWERWTYDPVHLFISAFDIKSFDSFQKDLVGDCNCIVDIIVWIFGFKNVASGRIRSHNSTLC